MSTPAKLESYLVKLDKALGPIAVSEKAKYKISVKSGSGDIKIKNKV